MYGFWMLKGTGLSRALCLSIFEGAKISVKSTFRGRLRVLKLRVAEVELFGLDFVKILFVLVHFVEFSFSFEPLYFLGSQEYVFEILVGFMFFFILFFGVFLFLVHLIAEYGLELALDILLSSEFPFVVHLASDFSDLDSAINELILEFVPLMEGTDVFALYILLIVHNHLIVLGKMR